MEYSSLENEIIDILKKKFNMLAEFLRVTELVKMTGNPNESVSEAEDYVFLIEKRENMLNKILSINKKLEQPKYNAFDCPGNIAFSEEVKGINDETNALISQIIELDKLNNSKADGILRNLKNSIKDINVGKNINVAYLQDVEYASGGFYDYKS